MINAADLMQNLSAHLELCREILGAVHAESQTLRNPLLTPDLHSVSQTKKSLLARLNRSLDKLRQHRLGWQQLRPNDRAAHPEIALLLRQNQDLIMKIIVLDRENEQSLLRRGLVPANHLPSVNQQRPHFVADLYRRAGNS